MPRFAVRVDDGRGLLKPLDLATDDKGNPLYTSHLLPPVSISSFGNTEEARYSSIVPGVGGMYSQTDLSGGLGKKLQVRKEDPSSNRYYFGESIDPSVEGQLQKGPATVVLTAPANSGTLSGYFELAGVPYLVLGRRIASWASDTLTAVHDFTAGIAGAQSAVFTKLAVETSVETNVTTSTVSTIVDPDGRLAQSFRLDDTGVRYLSSVIVLLTRTGAMTGDVRLSIQADLNGVPSGQIITSSSMLASTVPTVATAMTFRFDDDDSMVLPYNLPLWLVLDCIGATAALTMGWSRSSASDVYARGGAMVSTDRGNVWTAIAAPSDFYFTVNAKTATAAAFVGVSTGGQPFKTSTDGATFTNDPYRFSANFAVVGSRLVRSIAHGTASAETGTIEWSEDGTNWDSDAIVVGDPVVPITNLLRLGDALLVCKEDGVYVVDIMGDFTVEQIFGGNRVASNGVGANTWRGVAYIPFNGRLAAVEGDFTNGFLAHQSVGIECLPEWDWPWGAGRHTCVVGTRFHLYSLVVTGSDTRLLKCANPLKKNADGSPDPDWHGSLAKVGSTTGTMLAHFDPGGLLSPQLFMSLPNFDVQRIQLARSFNPASDPLYVYDNGTPGDLYFSHATGNYPVHPKAWLTESVTFRQTRPNDYVEMLYDDRNGEGFRRMPGSRLYDTDQLPYPAGLESRVLARQLRLVNSLGTASPLLLAVGVSYAMRHIKSAAMREISFTVVAEDGLSAADLGEMLGVTAKSERDMLQSAAGGGLGSRRMEDPYGHIYERVLFLDSTEVLQQMGSEDGGRTLVQVSAVSVG